MLLGSSVERRRKAQNQHGKSSPSCVFTSIQRASRHAAKKKQPKASAARRSQKRLESRCRQRSVGCRGSGSGHGAAQRWATTRRGGWFVSPILCIFRLASLELRVSSAVRVHGVLQISLLWTSCGTSSRHSSFISACIIRRGQAAVGCSRKWARHGSAR